MVRTSIPVAFNVPQVGAVARFSWDGVLPARGEGPREELFQLPLTDSFSGTVIDD